MYLPKGQNRVLRAIKKLQQQLERMPTVSELSQTLGLAHQSLRQHLTLLEAKGLLQVISRGQGRASEIVLSLQGKALLGLGIPLLGSVRAGPLSTANQEFKGLMALPSHPDYFALWVGGDSMADLLLEGMVVVVQAKVKPNPGEIAAVRYEDETTLKYFYREGSTVRLEPHNKHYPTIQLPARAVEVQGVYRSHIAGQLARELLEVFM